MRRSFTLKACILASTACATLQLLRRACSLDPVFAGQPAHRSLVPRDKFALQNAGLLQAWPIQAGARGLPAQAFISQAGLRDKYGTTYVLTQVQRARSQRRMQRVQLSTGSPRAPASPQNCVRCRWSRQRFASAASAGVLRRAPCLQFCWPVARPPCSVPSQPAFNPRQEPNNSVLRMQCCNVSPMAMYGYEAPARPSAGLLIAAEA